MNVKQEVVAALHADLKFGQVNGKGRAVLEDGLADPVVRAFVLADTHVGEPSAKRVEFTERHAGDGGVGAVRSGSLAGFDGLGGSHVNGTLKSEGLLFTGGQTPDGPGDNAFIKLSATGHFEVHLGGQRPSDDHVMKVHGGEVLDLKFHGNGAGVFADGHRHGAFLRAGGVGVQSLTQRHHLLAVDLVGHRVVL